MPHRPSIHGINRVVLLLAADGKSDAEIAAELKRTPEAVRQALHRICTQLGTDRQGAIARWKEGRI
jgi:DNA-binding CsgD family transcriptional regulator